MKINFIVPDISRTGGMRIIFEYANRLTDKGHDIILYSPNIPFNNYPGEFRPYYIKYRFKYSLNKLFELKKIPDNIFKKKFDIKFLWLFNDNTVRDADVTIATSWTTAYVVNKLNVSKGKKVYLIQDYEQWNSRIDYVDNSYKLNLNRITVSGYLQNLLIEKFQSHSTVIPCGIDFSFFNNPDKKFNERTQILFMDHMLENKNVAGAIEAIKSLKLKFPDLRVKCFGINNYNPLPDYIEFIKNPGDDKIKQLYCESDIFLYPAKYEGFGIPPAEAMACKCALVGNHVAAIPEFSENLKSAILTSPDHPEELVTGVEYLINNSDELERISFAGCENVKRVLNWNSSVDKFEKFISN